MIEGLGLSSPKGSDFNTLLESAIMTGLCTTNSERIKAGEFVQTCMLTESLEILSRDFGQSGSCDLFIAQDYFLTVSMALALPVSESFLSHYWESNEKFPSSITTIM